jgi:hypothetical protein
MILAFARPFIFFKKILSARSNCFGFFLSARCPPAQIFLVFLSARLPALCLSVVRPLARPFKISRFSARPPVRPGSKVTESKHARGHYFGHPDFQKNTHSGILSPNQVDTGGDRIRLTALDPV